jgi:cell division protein FtsI/penicillin-binding protein 2
MIFIVLIVLIALIVMGLNMMDTNNLEKIKDYLQTQSCTQIYYSRGSYKALCQEDIAIVENSFNLDIQKNQKRIKYDTIVNYEQIHHKVILTLEEDSLEVLEFKNSEEALNYYEKIQEKL